MPRFAHPDPTVHDAGDTRAGRDARAGGAADVAPDLPEPGVVVAHRVQHHTPLRVLVGVAHMEDVAGVDVEPAHVGGTVLAGHDPDPRAVRVRPPVRHAAVPGQGVVEDDGQVQPHDVVLGDGEVVHHRRPGHVDRPAVEQLPLRGDPVVGEVGRREPGPEQVQFTGDGVLLRVRGHRRGQLPGEVVRPDGLQLRSDPVRQADLAQGKDGVGVPDHVGVRGCRGQVDGAVLTDEGVTLQLPCLHPPVAVPLGPPAAQPDAVQHAGPGEPVPAVLAGQRVGAVAEVAAVQLGGRVPRTVSSAAVCSSGTGAKRPWR